MADNVRLEGSPAECKNAVRELCIQWLHDAGITIHKQTLDIYRAETGQAKNSFSYKVDEDELTCVVGSAQENAVLEEFGTGVYAENGNAGKTSLNNKNAGGKRNKTADKTGIGALRKSFKINEKPLQDRLADRLKGLK